MEFVPTDPPAVPWREQRQRHVTLDAA